MFAKGAPNAPAVRLLAAAVVVCLGLSGCGAGSDGADPTESAPSLTAPASTTSSAGVATTPNDTAIGEVGAVDDVMFPDVIDATASFDGATWTISATLSSPYDSPERYADAWRVVGHDGTVFGERILDHDHASEQPFTRSQSGIDIPGGVAEVVIEGRDLQFGYGGATFELTLPR